MLAGEANEIMRRVVQYVPQFQKLVEHRLQGELMGLPHLPVDKVQIIQGRCLLLQELLAELKALDPSANRTAKPNFSTP
jgi:hypothetical protein